MKDYSLVLKHHEHGTNVCVLCKVKMGKNIIIGNNVVLGKPGFGFTFDLNKNLFRIPQLGSIIIGNNVEIGDYTCIDKGAFLNTIIEDNVKIGKRCNIAHNTIIKKNTIIEDDVYISGSTIIGKFAYIKSNSSIRNKIKIGDRVLLNENSNAVNNLQPGSIYSGNPAKRINER